MRSMLVWDPLGARRLGRPRTRWLKELEEDLAKIGVVKWRGKTGLRKVSRGIVGK